LLLGTASAADDTWKFFKPYSTTEESVISIFGAPDAVKILTSYENFTKTQGFNGKQIIPAYSLMYTRHRGDLNVLKGPLGEAATAEVAIENGKVVAVNWEYAAKYKDSAEALWKRDKSFNTAAAGWVTIGEKKLPSNDVLFVTCTTGVNKKCDGNIQVTFSKDLENK
jgi:hypothetical protein